MNVIDTSRQFGQSHIRSIIILRVKGNMQLNVIRIYVVFDSMLTNDVADVIGIENKKCLQISFYASYAMYGRT